MNAALAAHMFAPRSLHNTADREEIKHVLKQRWNAVRNNKRYQEDQEARLKKKFRSLKKKERTKEEEQVIKKAKTTIQKLERKLEMAKRILARKEQTFSRQQAQLQNAQNRLQTMTKSKMESKRVLQNTAGKLRSLRNFESFLPPSNGFQGGPGFKRARNEFRELTPYYEGLGTTTLGNSARKTNVAKAINKSHRKLDAIDGLRRRS